MNELPHTTLCFAYVWCAISFLNISTDLHELIINIGKQHISAAVDDCDPKLINDNKSSWPKLNRMKMEQFEATKLDMAFVRSLLAASPALDKMEIEFSARHGLQDRW
ncbi:unnamed protein product [Linum trigynum]|uniref:Uncharacterized protein n=1 Tax=Linum trigynum TaxID=586398 RepID=A0AAV2FYI9_9ROSI